MDIVRETPLSTAEIFSVYVFILSSEVIYPMQFTSRRNKLHLKGFNFTLSIFNFSNTLRVFLKRSSKLHSIMMIQTKYTIYVPKKSTFNTVFIKHTNVAVVTQSHMAKAWLSQEWTQDLRALILNRPKNVNTFEESKYIYVNI